VNLVELVSFFYFFIIFYFIALISLILTLTHFILTSIILDLLILINIVIFVWASALTINLLGYNLALLLLAVGAAETAIGLGIFIVYFKSTRDASILTKIY
jgi:NADH:ubiquinone oxidoreductase subunit K